MALSLIRRVERKLSDCRQTLNAARLESRSKESKGLNVQPQLTANQAIDWLRDGRAGNSLVEFALTMPIFAFMLLGIFKTGMAFNNYLILEGAVNQGVYAVANNASAPSTTDPCNLAYNAVSSVTPQFDPTSLKFAMKLNNSTTWLTGSGSAFSCVIGPKGKIQGVTPNDPVVLTVSFPVDMNIMGVNVLPSSYMSVTAQQNVQVFTQ